MNIAASRLTDLVASADYWRCPATTAVGRSGDSPFKEWQHFVVFGDGWLLLFNLNIDCEAGSSRVKDARVITVLSGESWSGQVDRHAEPALGLCSLDATFGSAGMRWRAGRYEIWQHGPGIRLEVTLEPIAVPSLTHNIPLGPGTALSWCLVPRLAAAGWVECNGRRAAFAGRGAYHDHNWGQFNWGGDFSWEWGCAQPADPSDPRTLVFAHMNSRDRQRTTATSAFLLEAGRHVRYFRNGEVRFKTGGSADPRPAGRVPAAAALFLPDEDHDVARTTRITARRGSDWLDAHVATGIRGQILVPGEVDLLSVVRLNEADAAVQVKGECGGRPVEFVGPGLLEVVRA